MSNYNQYDQCDNDNVTDKFIKDIVLTPSNIKEHYEIDDNFMYGYRLFNQSEYDNYENYRTFREMIRKCNFDYFYIMYKIILPETLEYAEDFDMLKDVVGWLKNDDEDKIFNLYAFSIVYLTINRYEDYINDIYNNTTAKKIALMKLRRNKIVNEGIILKISMMRCGLF